MTSVKYEQSIVFVGSFTPSEYNIESFSKAKVFRKDEIKVENPAPNEQNFIGKDANVLVGPTRAIIGVRPSAQPDYILQIVDFVLGKNVKSIQAYGFNFKSYVFIEGAMEVISKDLFFKKGVLLYKNFFNRPDSTFGFIGSTSFRYSKLNLEVRPQDLLEDKTGELKKSFNVVANFHIDNTLPPHGVLSIILDDYSAFSTKYDEILQTIV